MLKQLIKHAFRAAGLEVRRLPPVLPAPAVHHGTDLLFDVGANVGGYARQVRQEGYRQRIVSFEPLPDAHAALQEAARHDPLWSVHPRCALGASIGTTHINIARNSVSSSIMPMLSSHESAEPGSVYVGTAQTSVASLDSVFQQYWRSGDKVFLKIDTQGFEAEVLEGCRQSMPHIHGVQLEMSTVPLYAGQKLYPYFFELFERQGFRLWTLVPGFTSLETGQQLQFDAVFFRGAGPA